MDFSALSAEIKKIPPVTRFLCGGSLAATLPVMLNLLDYSKLLYWRPWVLKNWELWRVPTSFFFGSVGLNFIFDFVMLYRNSNELEEGRFPRQSQNYAWQLLIACTAILLIDSPLNTTSHQRPLLVCLTYLTSALAPAGAQSNFFGLVTFPVAWMPYVMILLDFITRGLKEAARSVGGAIVGHIWWWGVFGRMGGGRVGLLAPYSIAPRWVKKFVSDGPGVNAPGVQSSAPESRTTGASTRGQTTAGGYQWGSGNRLGDR